jgi:hypothetical protein
VIAKEDSDQGHKEMGSDLEIVVDQTQMVISNPVEMEVLVETMDQ